MSVISRPLPSGGTTTIDITGISAGDNLQMQFPSIAAFRASTGIPAETETVLISGYYGTNTPGGGVLLIDRADTTTTDDGGVVFVNGDGLRAKRVSKNYFIDTEFGVNGTSAIDTIALQNAINAAANSTLYLTRSTSVVNSTLVVGSPITIIGTPGCKILLDSADDGLTPLLDIGGGTAEFSDVTIKNIIFDGNDAAIGNPATAGGSTGLLRILGEVSRIKVKSCGFTNARALGVNVTGSSGENRAKFINFTEDCWIDDVGEGIKIENCDHLTWDGGSMTNMQAQDAWEPHGNCSHVKLKNVYLEGSGPGNCCIEIFPQIGNIRHATVEDCHIVDNQMRISLGSGTGAGDFEVSDTVIRGNHFEHSIAYCGVNGKMTRTSFVRNHFEGNSNFADSAARPHSAIFLKSPSDGRNQYIGNQIDGYDGWGIYDSQDYGIAIGNQITDCWQNRDNLSGARGGISWNDGGDGGVAIGNIIQNVNGTTMVRGIESNTANSSWHIAGNLIDIPGDGLRFISADSVYRVGNRYDTTRLVVTIPTGSSSVAIDRSLAGLSTSDNVNLFAQPLGSGNQTSSPMAPATHAWFRRAGADLYLQLDAAVTNDCDFLIFKIQTSPRIVQP